MPSRAKLGTGYINSWPEVIKNLKVSTVEAAYAAGLVDGEGHVDPRRGVTLGNNDEAMIKWLYDRFGGRVRIYQRPNLLFYVWYLPSIRKWDFLATIRPYLVTKRAAVDRCFQYKKASEV